MVTETETLGMVLAVKDGIVVGTDSQYSWGDLRLVGDKIRLFNNRLFLGSGSVGLIQGCERNSGHC